MVVSGLEEDDKTKAFFQVAGEANEEQILTAAVVYQDRPNFLTKVLNDLYYILRSETCQSIHRALEVVLMAMDRHLPIKHTQISGSATLFYIVKGRSTINFGPTLKKHIIRTLLNGMSAHLSDDTMMRNGCLTLCQFSIPNDVVSVPLAAKRTEREISGL